MSTITETKKDKITISDQKETIKTILSHEDSPDNKTSISIKKKKRNSCVISSTQKIIEDDLIEEDNLEISNKIKHKARKSMDFSGKNEIISRKGSDAKDNKLIINLSAKKEKSLHYSGNTAAGRDWRGDVKTNQDSFIAMTHNLNANSMFYLLAVFDGHGHFGHCVSDFLKKYFTHYFSSLEGTNYLKKLTCAKIKEKNDYHQMMKKTYLQAEEQMVKSGIEYKGSGSTGLIIAVIIDSIICFNTGDSRAIFVSSDGQVHSISEDHKPKNPKEQKRILSQGGRVEILKEDGDNGPYRVLLKDDNVHGLAISRSIGDFEMKPAGLICDPDYFELSVRIQHIKIIVLGSDGIWDVLTNEKVRDIVYPYLITKNASEASKLLIQEATIEWVQKGVNCDDITAIVYFF